MLSVTEERIAMLCCSYVAVDGIEITTVYWTFLEEEAVILETPPKTNTEKKNYINAKKGLEWQICKSDSKGTLMLKAPQ